MTIVDITLRKIWTELLRATFRFNCREAILNGFLNQNRKRYQIYIADITPINHDINYK